MAGERTVAGVIAGAFGPVVTADQRAGPGMNNSPFLSVVVDVGPVCRSDLLLGVTISHLLFALVD